MNWIYKRFTTIKDLLRYVNDYGIERFGVVPDNECFWGYGYLLIYKK